MTNLTENWKANLRYFVVNLWCQKLFRGNTNIYVWLIPQYWNNTSRWNPSSMMPKTQIWLTLTNFPRNWPFVRGIHRSPLNSPHKGQWRGALMFSLICALINHWVNTREAGDLRRHRSPLWRHCNGKEPRKQQSCYWHSSSAFFWSQHKKSIFQFSLKLCKYTSNCIHQRHFRMENESIWGATLSLVLNQTNTLAQLYCSIFS